MHYSLLLPREIVFGWGVRAQVAELAKKLGQRVFLVTGGRSLDASGHLAEIVDQLRTVGLQVLHVGRCTQEPTIADVDELTATMMRAQARPGDVVVGIGGGAVLDLAKAAAAMVTNSQGRSVREFLEGVGSSATIDAAPLPLIALPTTAGTGTEATKNAVISVDTPPCKKSLRSPLMVPTIAIVDPELTVSCPAAVSAASGMDAITQLLESYVSRKANRFTRALCLDGLRGTRRLHRQGAVFALQDVVANPEDRNARETMSYAALMSGIALANSGLGFAHGVAAALGAHCGTPHGLACAMLLPTAMRINLPSVPKFDVFDIGFAVGASTEDDSDLLCPDPDNMPDAILHRITVANQSLGIPARLRDLNVPRERLPEIALGSLGNSMSGNPREMTVPEIFRVLEEIW